MRDIVSIGIMVLLWFVNLVNGTGLDSVYHITGLTKIGVVALFFIVFFFTMGNREKRMFDKNLSLTVFSMFVLFVAVSFVSGYRFIVFDYLWVYMLVFLIAQMKLKARVFFWTGIIYGVLGAAILAIYDFGTALSGWNKNSIAMLGMHSFLVLLVLFFRSSGNFKRKFFLLVITGIYSYLIFPTDSRSCILFMFVGAFLAFNNTLQKLFIGGRYRMIFILLIPLIIAAAVAMISGTNIAEELNIWSIEKFQKPIFNGRDTLWLNGFHRLSSNFLFGSGNLYFSGWHNSAITCLTAFGTVGFTLWINSFYQILKKTEKFPRDRFSVGMAISFMVLFIQQSVELGFIGLSPSILPYVMLGMLMGRIKYLEEKENVIRRI